MKACPLGCILVIGLLSGLCPAQESIDTLVADLRASASPSPGIGQAGQDVAAKFEKLGADGVPALIAVLDDKDEGVRDLASYALLDVREHLGVEHLDVLIRAQKRDDGWLPLAIATIGTPEAIEFLAEELDRDRTTENQLTWAFVRLGETGVPYLLELYRRSGEDDESLLEAINHILRKMREENTGGTSAIEALLAIAEDKAHPLAVRRWAALGIGDIGPLAQGVIPQLEILATAEAQMKAAIDKAIIEMGTEESAAKLAKELLAGTDGYSAHGTLRDIAELGIRGRGAAEVVLQSLKASDWETRVCAARTLGFIEYIEAAEELILLLANEEDWRLPYSAAEALGRFKHKPALAPLKQLAISHWYPPVRERASIAVGRIEHEENLERDNHSPREFFAYLHAGWNLPALTKEELVEKGFTFRADQSRPVSGAEIIKKVLPPLDKSEGSRRGPEMLTVLTVGNGLIAGTNRGEWGGELTFIDEKGTQSLIIEENIEDILKLGERTVATGGLAHLGMNSGCVYEVRLEPSGKWTATPWRMLPGSPQESFVTEGGDLIVSCLGGTVQITPEGKMRLLAHDGNGDE